MFDVNLSFGGARTFGGAFFYRGRVASNQTIPTSRVGVAIFDVGRMKRKKLAVKHCKQELVVCCICTSYLIAKNALFNRVNSSSVLTCTEINLQLFGGLFIGDFGRAYGEACNERLGLVLCV